MSASCASRRPSRSSTRSRFASSAPAQLDVVLAQQPERARRVVERRVVHVDARQMLSRGGVERGGILGIARLLVMRRGQAEQALAQPCSLVRQPVGRARMRLALGALEHGVVGHLMQDLVMESVFAAALGERPGCLPRMDELARHERPQMHPRRRVHMSQRRIPERHADHARHLQGASLRRGQAVEPGLQHADQRRRHGDRVQPLRVQRPALGRDADRARVDQHLDQFFHVEGIAFGPRSEQLAQIGRQLGKPLQQLFGQGAALCWAQRLQVDSPLHHVGGHAQALRPALEERRPSGAQQQQRYVAISLRYVGDEIERAVVGPVQVVELDDDRPSGVGMEAAQRQCRGMKGAPTELAGIVADAPHMRTVAVVEAEQVAEQVDVRLGLALAVGAGEQRHQAILELPLGVRHAIVVEDVQPPREQVM